MKNTIYYSDSAFKIGNHTYHTYFCEGMRGRGKSTYWLYTVSLRAYNDIAAYHSGQTDRITKKFVYLRRTDVELQKVINCGLYNSVFAVYPKFAAAVEYICECKNGVIYLGKERVAVGYYLDLNKVKSLSIEDADALLFDEIVAQNRSEYKGGDGGINEPNILARLDDTLFRGRENWHIYLGNRDTPTNPYIENWRIPYGSEKWKDKTRGLWYEFDKTDAAITHRKNTATGQRWVGTSYDLYATGATALGTCDPNLIMPRSKNSKLLYNIKVGQEKLTIWLDEDTGVRYVTDNCKFDYSKPIYCVFNNDMSVNSMFMAYNTVFVMWLKQGIACSLFRYNNQKTFSLFASVLGLT